MNDAIKEKIKGIATHGIDAVTSIVENDKTLIIFTLLVFGVLAMAMRIDGSMGLVDKLSAGLLGMAIGRTLDKKN